MSLEDTLGRHACVCPKPVALVLFTQWIAPVSCFLERVGARVTAAAYISTHSTLPLVHCAVPRVSSPKWTHPTRSGAPALLPKCSTLKWRPSCIYTFISCVICSCSGKHSFGWKEFWHWCEFFLGKNGMKGWIFFFFSFQNKENKTKTTTHLKNTYLWVVCNVHGFLVQQVTQTRNLASSFSPMFFAHSWAHS